MGGLRHIALDPREQAELVAGVRELLDRVGHAEFMRPPLGLRAVPATSDPVAVVWLLAQHAGLDELEAARVEEAVEEAAAPRAEPAVLVGIGCREVARAWLAQHGLDRDEQADVDAAAAFLGLGLLLLRATNRHLDDALRGDGLGTDRLGYLVALQLAAIGATQAQRVGLQSGLAGEECAAVERSWAVLAGQPEIVQVLVQDALVLPEDPGGLAREVLMPVRRPVRIFATGVAGVLVGGLLLPIGGPAAAALGAALAGAAMWTVAGRLAVTGCSACGAHVRDGRCGGCGALIL